MNYCCPKGQNLIQENNNIALPCKERCIIIIIGTCFFASNYSRKCQDQIALWLLPEFASNLPINSIDAKGLQPLDGSEEKKI